MSAIARARKAGFTVAAVVLAAVLSSVLGATVVSSSQSAAARAWVEGWGAAMTPNGKSFADQTIRMVVHNTAPGSAVRVRLSNLTGTRPLRIGAVDIAVQAVGGDAVPGTSEVVTFSGSPATTIPAQAELTSDPVTMAVAAQENLLISIYLPGDTGPSSWHYDAHELTYLSGPGNFAAQDTTIGYVAADTSWYYLEGLDVESATARCTVVAFGDSITNGFASTTSAEDRWPDFLALRLEAEPGGTAFGVVDEGLDSNRVLTDSLPAFGRSALQRFTHDALGQPGVRDVIVLEGINDIGFSPVVPYRSAEGSVRMGTEVTAGQIIAGYQQLIAAAHARGLRIFGATLLPFQGAGYYSAAGEATREAVNAWIRTSGAFDGVIDFDQVMRDPADPLRLNPAYDSGDHLHPNDAGYQAMANAINLAMLLPG
jgi:lysophospholipase L1-like esterase